MADFEKKLGYTAGGADPEDIKTQGFQAGYKPPASFFNWLFTRISDCIDELQTYCLKRKIQGYTAFDQIGITLGNETIEEIATKLPNNTEFFSTISDSNAKIYPKDYGVLIVTKKDPTRTIFEFYEKGYARKWYGMYDSSKSSNKWTGWDKNVTDADLTDFTSHIQNKNNPHEVTKTQVGLGNVPNVTTNDQTPTYSDTSNLQTLASGEKLNVALQKIKCAITRLIEHINTHKVQNFTTLADINLTDGQETIQGIAANLPDNSTLLLSVGESAANIYPAPYGTLYVMKKNISRVFFEYMERGKQNGYIGVYDSTNWSGWLNIATADDLEKYFLLDCSKSTTSANLYTNNKKGRVYTGANNLSIHHQKNGAESQDKDTRFIEMYSDTTELKYAFKVGEYISGVLNRHNLFGEHNKPSGSYNGNGSSNQRTINTGGIGNVLLIWTTASITENAVTKTEGIKVYVLPTGAVAYGEDNARDRGVGASEMKYENGVLTINSNRDWFNRSGVTYYYQCL